MRRLFQFLPLIGVVVLVMSGVALFTTAQETGAATPIAIGDTVEGVLDESTPRMVYVFPGEQGMHVRIALLSEVFDTFLILNDPAGEVLAQDDDSGDDLNAQIWVTLPADGDYTIIATSLREVISRGEFFVTGAYTLSLEATDTLPGAPEQPTPMPPTAIPTPAPTRVPAEVVAMIAMGETITGELTEAAPSLAYTFEAAAGDQVIITLISDDFDAYLFLRDSNDAQLRRDDDGAGESNARIGPYTIPADGVYTIVVDSYLNANTNQIDTGAFSLTLSTTGAQLMPTESPAVVMPTPTALPPTGAAIALTYGDVISGELVEGDPSARYTFNGTQGDVVVITLTSNEFDSYLVLLGPDGREVALDDDSAGGLNARIGPMELPGDGLYTILADSYRHAVSAVFEPGRYILTLETPQDGTVPAVGEIRVNDTVTGVLSPHSPMNDYTLTASAGEVITITLMSENFDPYLFLLSADGEELARNDDGAGTWDSRIAAYRIPADGAYIIRVNSYGNYSGIGEVSGQYTLIVESLVIGDMRQITFGATISDELSPENDFAHYYAFQASAGDRVVIRLLSAEFDAYLRLQDPDSYEIAYDDDSAGNLDAQIGPLEIPINGEYIIIASSLQGTSAGRYTLSLDVYEEAPPREMGAIAIGETVRNALSADASSLVYTFEARRDDIVTITLTSEQFDAYLTLLDADGSELARDDDSAGELNAQIAAFRIPADGQYRIIASSFGHTFGVLSTGAFELSLSAGVPITITPPPTPEEGTIRIGDTVTGRLAPNMPSAAYTFYALAGNSVTITLLSQDFDAYLTLLDPFGQEAAYDDDSAGELNARISRFVIPQDGLYTIVAESYGSAWGGSPGVGSFSLTLAEAQPIEVISYPMAIGQTVDGLIEQDTLHEHTFEASAGDLLVITLRSPDFDTYLILKDSTGAEIASDDDSAGDLNSRIGPFAIPADGTYHIVVDNFGHATGGEYLTYGVYTLSLAQAVITPIEYTQTVTGVIDLETPFDLYAFTGAAGDLVTIQVTPYGEINARVQAVDGDFYDELYGDALIGPFSLPVSGQYHIVIDSYDPYTRTPYTLSLEHIIPVEVDLDFTVITDFASTPIRYYSFDGKAGDVIGIHVNSNQAVDTSITVIGMDGYQMAYDDDGGAGFDPEIIGLVLPEDGTYSVVVRPYILGDNGNITLEITRNALPSLDDGGKVVRISDKQPEAMVIFSGIAGERVQLSIRVRVAGNIEPRVEARQDGVLLASNSLGKADRIILEFVVPSNGTVQVKLTSEYAASAAIVEYTLERVGE